MNWRIAVLQPGDHIRVKRDHYYHHGIFVGNNEVIHYTGESGDGFAKPKEVLVRKTSLEFFLQDGVAEHALYNKKEKRLLRKPEEIVKLAKSKIGEGHYNIVINNCETFANEMCYVKLPKEKVKHNFFIRIARLWYKLTGWIAFWVYIKPRYFKTSCKAKKEAKDIKGGAIIISNHTSILDAYLYIFKYFGHVVHVMTAELVYRMKFVAHLCKLFENIKVDREDISNVQAMKKAKEYLDHGESVVIFPEGYIEKEKNQLLEIKPSVIKLAYDTGKPIIPYFTDGKYGLFKRTKVIVGEKIYVRELVKDKDELTDEDIEMLREYIANVFKTLKRKLNNVVTYHTQGHQIRAHYATYLYKAIYYPFTFLLWPWKRIFIGDKKKFKEAYKDGCILCPTHTSGSDAIIMYFAFYKRLVRILGIQSIRHLKILNYFWTRTGVVKYDRDAPGGFDMRAYRECGGILDGNGCLVIFPQGHIDRSGLINEMIHPGAANHALRHNVPIIPIVFANKTGPFRFNRILIDDPLYPKDFLKEGEPVTTESIDRFNQALYDSMMSMQKIALEYKKHKKEKRKGAFIWQKK